MDDYERMADAAWDEAAQATDPVEIDSLTRLALAYHHMARWCDLFADAAPGPDDAPAGMPPPGIPANRTVTARK